MSDDDEFGGSDWEAKYWANRQRQLDAAKHAGPAHQQHTPSAPRPFSNVPQHQMRDIDPMQLLQQQMMMGQGPSSSGRPVFLREGADYFRHIQGADGFGNVIPLVRNMGKLSGVVGKEFAFMGETRGICVDGMQMVDMSKVNEDPSRVGMYVRVRAPFVGDILVERNAVIELQQNGQRQILRG